MRANQPILLIWASLSLAGAAFVAGCNDVPDHSPPAEPAETIGTEAETDGGSVKPDADTQPAVVECSDGVDNDGDGLVDWQLDLGCTGPNDPTEGGLHDVLDEGWTVFEAGPDTSIYYVSSSTGNDAWSGLAPEWDGTDGPKQTPAAAIALMLDGKPDWLLFKRGDVWVDQPIGNWRISGASTDRPVVIATYGSSAERPRFEVEDTWLRTTGSGGASEQRSHVRIIGIHVRMYSKDPEDPRFTGLGGNCLLWLRDGGDVLVEDVKCEYAPFALQSQPTLPFTVRRSVFTNNYAVDQHAQNIYTEIAAPLTLEQNVLSHGGWNDDFRLALWAPETDPTVWAAVTDGRFGFNLAGTHFDIAGVDLSSASDMQAVASTVQDAINAAVGADAVRLLFTEGGAFQLRAPSHPRAPLEPVSDYYAVTPYSGADPGTDIADLFNTASQGSPEGTVFNRNMYLACGQGNTVVRGNIDANGASGGVQQRMGGINEDNLFLRNPHAVVFGSNQNPPGSYVGGAIRNNVVLGSRDIDTQPQGSGLLAISSETTEAGSCGTAEPSGPSPIRDLEISGNILAHNVHGTFNFKAISLQGDGPHENVNVHDNIIYDWAKPSWPDPADQRAFGMRINCAVGTNNVEVHHNVIQQPNGGFLMLSENRAAGVRLHDNTYWSAAPDPPDTWSRGWFSLGRSVSLEEWLEATGEPRGQTIVEEVQFLDPNRTIETYMASLGEDASYDAFIEHAIHQSKYNWRTEYTAEAVRAYIRAGFDMKTPIETEEFSIRYDSWSDDIVVENKHLKHVATEYEFDDPVRGVPSSSQTVTRTDADLSDEQSGALRDFVRTSGFDTLGETYGAPEGVRYYPYTLTLVIGEDSKQVTFRSNPSYDIAPEAFQSIERYLFDLSRQLREAVSSDLYLMYDSADDDIEIEARHIRHVRTRYKFDSPMTVVPSSSQTEELVDADLTQAEYDELVRFIHESGFESLAPAYGAPVDRRHYPYVLTVGFGDERKVVTYRSNPSYDEAPERFKRVKEYVLQLSDRVRSRTSG
jgi:hypothetical protein